MNAEDLAAKIAGEIVGTDDRFSTIAKRAGAVYELLPYANLLLRMREALKALSGQAKLARPSSLMVPLIDDAEETLLSASRLLGDE